MAEHTLRKRYMNHFGVDLKSSDITRPEQFASNIKNAQYRKSGSIEKRRGYQGRADGAGGHGLFTYNRVNTITAADEPEVLSVSNTVNKLLNSTLTVTYTGAEAAVLISIFYDSATSQYRCTILEGTSNVLDEALGLGIDEASPVTVDDLRSDIDALTDFTATVTGATTTPAAFLKITRDHDLSSTGAALAVNANYWEAVNTPVAAPLAGSETNKNSLDFENVTSTQLNNIIYFANGYDNTLKYDGQNLYRAGLPTPASVSTALVGGGSITGTNYVHLVHYRQIDNSGNVIEGNFLKSDPALSPTGESIDVTISNVLAASGFNTNCAVVAGAQVTVNTITVDDGSGGSHTMKAGDTAYFFDSVTGDYVERNVTSVAATTITVAGSAVTVADNAVISNNLRISIFRNETSATTPTVFFLVDEIPNDSFSSTQVYNDDKVDSALGSQFIEPLTDRSPPPKGRYISQFRNQMVIAGNLEAAKSVFYSDVDSPEYFPSGVNTFDVQTVSGDIISGIAPNNDQFVIFANKSIHTVSGNIADNTIRVSLLTEDIGCAAHASIQDVRGTLFFLSDRGPYQMTAGQIPIPVGDNRIEPLFDGTALSEQNKDLLFGTQVITDENLFRLKRSVAINDRDMEHYILYVPAESVTSGDRYANDNSRVFVHDYDRDAWLVWDNINGAGGFAILDENLYFQERRYSSFNTSVDHVLYIRHNLADAWDYQDNNAAVDFEYASFWESLGEPSILKRFIRFRLFSLETSPNSDLCVNVKTELNYVRGVAAGDFTLNFGGGGYGVSAYGTSPYGNPIEPTLKHKLNIGRSRSMRVRLLNSTEQENLIVSGWELELAVAFRVGFKS